MGQQLSPSLQAEPSAAIMSQLSNRFTILPHPYYSTTANLKLLNDRNTNVKYVLRIITTNNESEHHRIEELINKKIANKNCHLTKLEQYFFEHQKSYCGNLSKCYILFNVGQAIVAKDYFLMRESGKNYEQQLIRGLNSLINGVLWLKAMQTPHGNISSQNVYLAKDEFILADPWIAPQGADLNDRFPSPEKLMKINNKIQDYDLFASDLFSIGMTVLEISKQEKLQRIYKKNYTLNTEALIDQVSKCPYPKLRETLRYILLSSENNRKQYLYDHEIAFKMEQQNIENNRDRKQKGGIKRINVMSSRQNPIKAQPQINYQIEAQPRNFSRQNKIENHFNPAQTRQQINFPIIHQNSTNFAPKMVGDNDTIRTRAYSHSKVNVNTVPSYPVHQTVIYQVPQFNPPPQPQLPITPNVYDRFPKFTLMNEALKPQNSTNIPTSQNSISHNQYSNVIQQSESKSGKKIGLNDKLNRYYYQHVVKSENNINLTLPKPFNIPSLPSIPTYTSDKYQSKYISAEENAHLKQEKQHRIGRDEQTPHSYKPTIHPDSNSAEFNEYLHCIDEKINTFQAGVSNAIQNTIMEIQKTPEIEEKQSFKTVEDNRSSQKQQRKLIEDKNSNLPNSEISTRSQLVHQSEDVHLPQSCKPTEVNHKEQSEPLSDSLLSQLNRIEASSKIEHNQYNKQSPEVVSAVAYGINSQQNEAEQHGNQNVLRSFSNEPENDQENRNTIIHGTQLQSVSNLAIPEEASSQEESFDSNLESAEQKGTYCEEYYENGGIYKGLIKNGERNGQGTFYYRDGGYYEGQWKDNKMNGFGRLYYESGELAYQGQWFRDEFHGRGKIYNDNPQKLVEAFNYKDFENQDLYWKYYEGDLSYDTKEGHGKLVLSNGEYYIGEFKGDRPSGRGHFHQLTKKVIHGIWLKGKLVKQI